MSSSAPVPDEEIDVLVIGGSLVGLSTAMFLGVHGIRALAVERHRPAGSERGTGPARRRAHPDGEGGRRGGGGRGFCEDGSFGAAHG